MEIDFNAIIAGFIFFGGAKAIQAAVEWCKRLGNIPNWGLAILPVFFGLVINLCGMYALGYVALGFKAVFVFSLMGILAGFMAMGLYDDKQVVK